MPNFIECIVVEPPTGNELLENVKDESGFIPVVLRPQVEVPAMDDIELGLKIGGITLDNPEFRATMRASSIEPSDKYASVVLRVSHEVGAAATATVIAFD